MQSFKTTHHCRSESDLTNLGEKLTPLLRLGDIVLLSGGLGAGKTTLARGIVRALCGDIDVPSPTYTLVQTYECSGFDIWHFDLYRLQHENEIWELGIEDAFENGVCLLEWPQRISGLLTGNELEILIEIGETTRTVTISGTEHWGDRLAHVIT